MKWKKSATLLPVWMLTGLVAMSLVQTACVTGRQFREAALPSLESGMDLILDGVVDGLFAAIDVESSSDSTAGG